MSELAELYQELIIDHGRRPRNFGRLTHATHIKEGYNPLCGDKLTVYLVVEGDKIAQAHFEGVGCAISMASASLMTEALIGKNFNDLEKIFLLFQQVVTGRADNLSSHELGKLQALTGVAEFPMRVKCATLAWHTVMAAVKNSSEIATTE